MKFKGAPKGGPKVCAGRARDYWYIIYTEPRARARAGATHFGAPLGHIVVGVGSGTSALRASKGALIGTKTPMRLPMRLKWATWRYQEAVQDGPRRGIAVPAVLLECHHESLHSAPMGLLWASSLCVWSSSVLQQAFSEPCGGQCRLHCTSYGCLLGPSQIFMGLLVASLGALELPWSLCRSPLVPAGASFQRLLGCCWSPGQLCHPSSAPRGSQRA